MDINKKLIIQTKWAEVSKSIVDISDDELIERIEHHANALLEAQTAYECVKAERNERAKNLRSKFAREQSESDRLYSPRPNDKIEYDRKAREEKVTLTKDEKAIAKLMEFGLSKEDAMKTLADGKKAKV